MSIVRLTFLSPLFLSASVAFSVPVVFQNLNTCRKTTFGQNTEQFQEMIHQASQSEHDTSTPISRSKVFSSAQNAILSKQIGYCECQSNDGRSAEQTCSVAGADGVVAASFHLLKDWYDKDCRPKDKNVRLSCRYSNRYGGGKDIDLRLTPGNVRFFGCDGTKDDIVFMRQAQTVAGVGHIPFDVGGAALKRTDRIVTLSHFTKNPAVADPDPDKDIVFYPELLVQTGNVIGFDRTRPSTRISRTAQANISSFAGNSGAPVLVIRNGKPLLKGFVRGGLGRRFNKQPAFIMDPITNAPMIDPRTKEPLVYNYTELVELTSPVVGSGLAFGSGQMAGAGLNQQEGDL